MPSINTGSDTLTMRVIMTTGIVNTPIATSQTARTKGSVVPIQTSRIAVKTSPKGDQNAVRRARTGSATGRGG